MLLLQVFPVFLDKGERVEETFEAIKTGSVAHIGTDQRAGITETGIKEMYDVVKKPSSYDMDWFNQVALTWTDIT